MSAEPMGARAGATRRWRLIDAEIAALVPLGRTVALAFNLHGESRHSPFNAVVFAFWRCRVSQSTRCLSVWGQPGRAVLFGLIALASLAGAAAAQETGQAGSFTPLAISAAIHESAARSASAPASASATEQAPAQGGDAAVLSFFRGTELSGFVDMYYSYNFNKPKSPCATVGGVAIFTCLRNFDVAHNSFALNLAEVALEKKPTADSRGGFRVDLDYGSTAAIVHGGEPGGVGVFQNIQQAYISYLAPVGKGLQFDFGKFVTQHGAEVIETKDNWNYSRSLLFALAIPYYHMGVRATYTINDQVTVMGDLVNGWNNTVDNNTGKTVGAQVMVKPVPALAITANYMGGPEQNDNNDGWRHLFDATATYTATPQVSLMANVDVGHDVASDASWHGIGGYLKYQPNPWFALTPRYEHYRDRDAFTTCFAICAGQTVQEFTITGEVKHKDGVMLRFEYRRDFSDVPYFLKNTNQLKKSQDTFTLGLVYAFSSKTP